MGAPLGPRKIRGYGKLQVEGGALLALFTRGARVCYHVVESGVPEDAELVEVIKSRRPNHWWLLFTSAELGGTITAPELLPPTVSRMLVADRPHPAIAGDVTVGGEPWRRQAT